jgi:nicotinate-nucleotide pyrophosphorylase (carboxylating)
MTLHQSVADALRSAQLDPDDTGRIIRNALAEDLRYGPDVTTAAIVPPGAIAVADIVARQPGVLAGLPVAAAVMDAAGIDVEAIRIPTVSGARAGACADQRSVPLDGAGTRSRDATMPGIKFLRADRDLVQPGDVVAQITAPLRELLTAERTLLNFLTHLSGIATATKAWVDAVAGTGCQVRDTRKTIPGLRALEKYAVRCGGGVNHRMGLGDAALIKDNHVAAAGGITAAFHAVRNAAPDIAVEVECDTLTQVTQALQAGATLILLDNMSRTEMRAAVELARQHQQAGQPARLEASGGLRLENASEVAETGVDFLAVGALTHSSPALDLALDLDLNPGLVNN